MRGRNNARSERIPVRLSGLLGLCLGKHALMWNVAWPVLCFGACGLPGLVVLAYWPEVGLRV